MKNIFIGLLLIFLIFVNCRRKSSTSEVTSSQSDTTELPPGPPGSTQDSTDSQNQDTTDQTITGFSFIPQKQNLENGNLGIVYKEEDANILSIYVNISGGNDVFGVTFDIDYDSSKIIFKKVTEGNFLSQDGAATTILFKIPHVGISRSGSGTGSVSGDGAVCIIELEAKEAFDNLSIGFKNQSVQNKELIEVLPANNWFGGVLSYK